MKKQLYLFCSLWISLFGFFACVEPIEPDNDDTGNDDGNGRNELIISSFTVSRTPSSDAETINGVYVDNKNNLVGTDGTDWRFAAIGQMNSLQDFLRIPTDEDVYLDTQEVKTHDAFVGVQTTTSGCLFTTFFIKEMGGNEVAIDYYHCAAPLTEAALTPVEETRTIGINVGDKLSLSFKTPVSYLLEGECDWLKATFGFNSLTFTVSQRVNLKEDTRQASFTLKGVSGDKISHELTIVQHLGHYVLTEETKNYRGDGGTFSSAILANVEWTASCDDSWCTLLVASGANNGEVTYELAPNTDSETRETTIWIAADELEAPQALKISQDIWFNSGTGTEIDPYTISNLNQLRLISEITGEHYYLMVDDIDMLADTQDHHSEPIALGKSHLDGGGHLILNLSRDTDENNSGFFTVEDDATISNLHIQMTQGEVLRGGDYVGGFIGYTQAQVTLTNCQFTGNVVGRKYAGGIIARASKQVQLYDCKVEGTIEAPVVAGGIVGSASGKIEGCSFDGKVTASSGAAGGILGSVEGHIGRSVNTIMKECATAGSIRGLLRAGGLIGQSDATGFHVQVYNSFSNSSLEVSASDSESYAGGLIGFIGGGYHYLANSYYAGKITAPDSELSMKAGIMANGQAIDLNNSYFDKEVSGVDYSTGKSTLGAKTTEEMNKKETYSGWDFTSIWSMTDGSYPTLQRIDDGE